MRGARRLRAGTVAALVLGLPLAGPRGAGPDAFAELDWGPAPHAAAFAVRFGPEATRNRIAAFAALPGERVRLEAWAPGGTGSLTAAAAGGELVETAAGSWEWRAPSEPGLYPILVRSAAPADSIRLQAFVAVPRSRLSGESLNGYRIGRYPAWSPAEREVRRPPAGFIEVTPDLLAAPVSPRLRLGQFLCKQEGGFPKYVVLDPRLPLKLEYLLDRAAEAGYEAPTFHVMSGYRTPAYNRSLGNVRFSRHVWGAAADIFVDADGDGRMDDLDGDGRSGEGDALALYRLIDGQSDVPAFRRFVGGLGRYGSTPAHGPFVHVDVRGGSRARW